MGILGVGEFTLCNAGSVSPAFIGSPHPFYRIFLFFEQSVFFIIMCYWFMHRVLENGLFFEPKVSSGDFGSTTRSILKDSDGHEYGILSEEGNLSIFHPTDGLGIFSKISDIIRISRCSCDGISIDHVDGKTYHAGSKIISSVESEKTLLLKQSDFENDGSYDTAMDVLRVAIHIDKFLSFNVISERIMVDLRIFSEYHSVSNRVPLTDVLLTELHALAERKTPDKMKDFRKLRISRERFYHVVEYFARNNPYNPFLDRFRYIKWDGVPRVDSLLSDCGGVDDENYLRWVSKALILGTLQRQQLDFKPEPIQCVPVLIGPTGIGKSTLLNRLGLDDYHQSTTVSTRDVRSFHESVSRCVIAELDECSQFRGRDSNHFKSLINQHTLSYRCPYARVSEDHPIRFMMVGTTNHPDVLEDQTSNRRFYPVRMSKENAVFTDIFYDLSIDYILQIWAEGLSRFESGERWHDGMDEIRDVAELIRDESTCEGFGVDEIKMILNESDVMSAYGKVPTSMVRDILHTRFGFNPRDSDKAVRVFNMICNKGGLEYCYTDIKYEGRTLKGYRKVSEGSS